MLKSTFTATIIAALLAAIAPASAQENKPKVQLFLEITLVACDTLEQVDKFVDRMNSMPLMGPASRISERPRKSSCGWLLARYVPTEAVKVIVIHGDRYRVVRTVVVGMPHTAGWLQLLPELQFEQFVLVPLPTSTEH